MGIFGWSLPPGCGTLPGEETGAVELTDRVRLPQGIDAVFWDEDGQLIEAFGVTVQADPENGTPEYTEAQNAVVGVLEWDDNASEIVNLARAAARYNQLTEQRTCASSAKED